MDEKEVLAKINAICGKCCHNADVKYPCPVICEDVIGWFDLLDEARNKKNESDKQRDQTSN